MMSDPPLAPLRPGGGPLHRRAEAALRRLAEERRGAGGALLPPETLLAERWGISRGTVRAAITRLVAEGLLERRSGVGTRVVERAAESAITAWRSFGGEMARRGVAVELFRLDRRSVPAPAEVAAALRVGEGTPVTRLDRVRGWSGTPVLRSRSWFHPLVEFAPDEPFAEPLYRIVAAASGLDAARAHESFGAEVAGAALARDLQVRRGTPLLLRRHTVFDRADQPIEFAEVHYVSTRFTLTLDLRREEASI